MVSNQDSSGESSSGSEQIPPVRDGEINQIPDLNEGDTVLVETKADYAPDRKLTVTETESDAKSQSIVAFRGDGDGYVLEGYGTEYHLITTGTPHWQRVDIVFASYPEGQIVSNIDVLNRSQDTGTERGGGDA